MSSVKPSPPKAKKSRRDANREATRAHIVEVAARLFLSQGFRQTTLVEIAEQAGVAVQTVYNTVGGKSAVLREVFEARVSGEPAPRTVPDLLGERTSRIDDPRSLTRMLANWFVDVHARMAPLWQVIDEAAAHDLGVARLAEELAQRRLDNYGKAARALDDLGGLPDGLDREELAALIWAVGHPTVYRTLVGTRGWSPDRYRRWVEQSLGAVVMST